VLFFFSFSEITPENHPVKGIPNVPNWNEEVPIYLQISSTSSLRSDYVSTWNNPEINNVYE
jgi:hypothetical protein